MNIYGPPGKDSHGSLSTYSPVIIRAIKQENTKTTYKTPTKNLILYRMYT